MNLGEKILEMFNDCPLREEERELFVNRVPELNKMKNIGRLAQRAIYGVAGETGCGKTTLFNLLRFPGEPLQKIVISISEKESKEAIIADFLYKLCHFIKEHKIAKLEAQAEKAIRFLGTEETSTREKSIKVGKIVEGESRWAILARQRYSIPLIREKIHHIIGLLTEERKVVLCIDEIDKEQPQNVVVILDSMKDVLRVENLLCLFALPQAMYRQYVEDRAVFLVKANLENILKDVVSLDKMQDDEIREILSKRTQGFPEVLPEGTRDIVIEFADGNPREALLVCQNALLSKTLQFPYKKEEFILTVGEIKDEMEKFIETWIDSLKLSSREEEALRIISCKSVLLKSELFQLILKKSKMPKSTLSETIENLVEKRALLKKKNAFYQVNRKVKLHYDHFVR
jgi:macrodomain Ter protein organizer (MatP/YcbG family)